MSWSVVTRIVQQLRTTYEIDPQEIWNNQTQYISFWINLHLTGYFTVDLAFNNEKSIARQKNRKHHKFN